MPDPSTTETANNRLVLRIVTLPAVFCHQDGMAAEAALRFWQAVAEDPRISKGFSQLALETLGRLLAEDGQCPR